MTSFFAELKRRNVLRVAVLYAIVGWVVIQIADIVIPALGIPAWTLSFIIVVVALGAPIALVLAWACELTPLAAVLAYDQIRVTAQLVKVADGYHLWSDTYDREL